MIYMYYVGPSSKASLPGWTFGPPGYAYKLQLATPEEVEMATDAGWRETMVEAIAAYESSLLPAIDAPADPAKRGPGRPRKEQP